MKTITCNRYAYSFYRDGDQPVVAWSIDTEVKQIVRVSREAGNTFYSHLRKLQSVNRLNDRSADHAFVDMFCDCTLLNLPI